MKENNQSALLMYLNQGRYSAQDLARLLEVSLSTVARAIADLRRRGYEILSIRRGMNWAYGLESPETVSNHTIGENSFKNLRGFIATRDRAWSDRHDEYLYGVLRDPTHPTYTPRRKRRKR